jgi:hypothetical protein
LFIKKLNFKKYKEISCYDLRGIKTLIIGLRELQEQLKNIIDASKS